MKNIVPYAIKGTGFLGLFMAGSMLTPEPAVAIPEGPPVDSVNVVNTPSVTISGTPAVTVSGTPTVTLSGTPTVALSGGSTVTLAPGGSVTVGNTVIIRDSDNPARNGISVVGTVDVTPGTNNNVAFGPIYTVPANQRLVIESINAHFNIDPGLIANASVSYGNNGAFIQIPCSLLTSGTPSSADTYVCSNQLTRGYADAGTDVVATLSALNKDPEVPIQFLNMTVSLSGYLVSMP